MVSPRLLGILAAVVLTAGACSSGSVHSQTQGDAGAGRTAVDPAACGLDAFAAAPKPVEVKFWHVMSHATADWLAATTNAFNHSQPDVHVTLVQLPNYEDLHTKYLAGLSTHALPDVFTPSDIEMQRLIDSQSVVPIQACVDADHYSLTPMLPRARAYFSYQGALWGMPWSLSNPVLGYNRAAFLKAGLDPDKPPRTLDELKQYSQKIIASHAATYGIALRVEPFVFEFLNAKSGGTFVNHGNGREGRATATTLDTPTARAIWTWWNDMVRSGLALNTGSAPGNIDHLIAVGTGTAAMAIEGSGALGNVKQALASGQYSTVKLGAAPLPSLHGGGGAPVGDGSLWIPKAAKPATRGAAWQYIKYLASSEQQAALAAEGGYAPMRADATSVPALVQRWRTEPLFRVGYDQLTTGAETTATAGSLIGDYQGVRDAVRDGLLSMLTDGLTPDAALQRAQRQADTAIRAYNERLGLG